MLEMTQYKARPLGKEKVNRPNMAGIIHNIIRLVEACLGSAVGTVVIFCWTHMEAATKTGRRGKGSGRDRSSQRKRGFNGTAWCTWLSQG